MSKGYDAGLGGLASSSIIELIFDYSFAGSIILGVTFGMEIQPKNDPYIILAEKALHAIIVAGNIGAYMGTLFYFTICNRGSFVI